MNAVEKIMIVTNYALTHLAPITACAEMDIIYIKMENHA